jgi:hypothetical protein
VEMLTRRAAGLQTGACIRWAPSRWD